MIASMSFGEGESRPVVELLPLAKVPMLPDAVEVSAKVLLYWVQTVHAIELGALPPR